MELAYGVIGNTTDFGSVIPGSSPGRPTQNPDHKDRGFFMHLRCSGLPEAELLPTFPLRVLNR